VLCFAQFLLLVLDNTSLLACNSSAIVDQNRKYAFLYTEVVLPAVFLFCLDCLMFFGTFYTLFVLFNKLFIAREVVYFSVLLGSSWLLCIYSVNGYLITGNVYNFKAPIHNNVYCASSRVEYFVVLIFCSVTTLCDQVCQWTAAGWWFSLGTPISSTNKTDYHDITEILLKVTLNTTTLALFP
jgi:hypothetical protein